MRIFGKGSVVAMALAIFLVASIAMAGLPPVSPITQPAIEPGAGPVRQIPPMFMSLGNGLKITMNCDDPTAFNLRFSGQVTGANGWLYQSAIMPGAIYQGQDGQHYSVDQVALTCTQGDTVEWYYYNGPIVAVDALNSAGYSLPDISAPPVVRGLPVNALVGLE